MIILEQILQSCVKNLKNIAKTLQKETLQGKNYFHPCASAEIFVLESFAQTLQAY